MNLPTTMMTAVFLSQYSQDMLFTRAFIVFDGILAEQEGTVGVFANPCGLSSKNDAGSSFVAFGKVHFCSLLSKMTKSSHSVFVGFCSND